MICVFYSSFCVSYAALLHMYRGFHTDSSVLYGVEDRGRNTRPETTDPVNAGRLFFINFITAFSLSGFGYRKPDFSIRRSVSVPNSAADATRNVYPDFELPVAGPS